MRDYHYMASFQSPQGASTLRARESSLLKHLAVFVALALTLMAPLRAQESWSATASPTLQNLWGVASGAGLFVAVGDNGTILTSPDGLAWTARASGTTNWLVGVAFASNQFVAVGDKGMLLTSPDGLAWTPRTSGTTERLNAVAFGNDRWLAVGEHGANVSSADAITWASHPAVASEWLRGLCFAYGGFVSVGQGGQIVATADANVFFHFPVPTGSYFEGVTYARRRFVAVGENGLVLTSLDAATWRGAFAPAQMRAVTFFNNVFVGAGANGSMFTSPDGTAWTARATGTTGQLLGVAASSTTIVAVGVTGTLLRSTAAPTAPAIVTSPVGLTEAVGNNVQLSVTATGAAPLGYQWLLNGLPIVGATADTLTLTNLQLTHGGRYAVTVTNVIGSATSSFATLTVVPTLPAPTGIIDVSFAADLAQAARTRAIVVQPDGRILTGGDAGLLARLNSDGSRDPSFVRDPTLPTTHLITSLVRQPDGRILAGGGFNSVNVFNEPNQPFIVRYNSDGTRDPTLSFTAALGPQAVTQLTLQPDGKIIVVNSSTKIYRLNANGSLDSAFNVSEFGSPPLTWKRVAVASDGRIYAMGTDNAGGIFGTSQGYLIRLRADGSFDPTFATPVAIGRLVAGFEPRLLQINDDGRILYAALGVGLYGGGWKLDRVNADGSPDLTFTAQTGTFGRYGGTMAATVEADGNIVVLTAPAIPPSWTATRFLPDGTNSQTLSVPDDGNVLTGLTTIAPYPGGGVLVGGINAKNTIQPALYRLAARNVAIPANPPVIISDLAPRALTVPGGDPVTLQVAAAGTAPLVTLWRAQLADTGSDSPLPATDDTDDTTLTIPNIRATATYYATVRNAAGLVASPAIVVNVTPRAPAFVTTPVGVSATSGFQFIFHASFVGSGPLTYQWLFNGQPAGDPVNAGVDPIVFLATASVVRVGTYQLVVRNALGTVTSDPVTLSIDPRSRLTNVGTRGFVGAGDATMIAGFVIAGREPKHILIRGVGPGLAQFGVVGYLVDPKLLLYDAHGVKLEENDNAAGADLVSPNWFGGLGAFRLQAGTLDAIINTTLPPGSYTVQVAGANNSTGIALAEVYENNDDNARLVNVSTRLFVGTGEAVAIPGVVIKGTQSHRLLVRAIGPTLSLFGVSGTLVDPQLTLVNGVGVTVATNDNWSDNPNKTEIVATAASTGAFALPTNSKDAALLVTVPPGSYTALVSGVGNTTGVALVEVYEVP